MPTKTPRAWTLSQWRLLARWMTTATQRADLAQARGRKWTPKPMRRKVPPCQPYTAPTMSPELAADASKLLLRGRHGVVIVRRLAAYIRDAVIRHSPAVYDEGYMTACHDRVYSTIIRKIDDRRFVRTLTALQTMIEQVAAKTGRKFGFESHRRQNPKHRTRSKTARPSDRNDLILYGLSALPDVADRAPSAEEAVRGRELETLIAEISRGISPVELHIYMAVQELRLAVGIKNIYPPVAARVICGIDGTIVGLAPPASESLPDAPPPPQPLIKRIRAIYQKVRKIFTVELASAGYEWQDSQCRRKPVRYNSLNAR
jgi:hypothetical protein